MKSDGQSQATRGETQMHAELKELSKNWLGEQGCRAVATEVRLPLSAYRVDAAGYRSSGRSGVFGETFALECKQSRADFLRDAGIEKRASREREELKREVDRLRALLGIHLPDCRQGVSLFSEYDEYDFGELRHKRWRSLVARLALLERRLVEGVKFSRLARYGSANFLYLVVTEKVLVDLREVPPGWGCLKRSDDVLIVEKTAPKLVSREGAKLAYLERIAARAARS